MLKITALLKSLRPLVERGFSAGLAASVLFLGGMTAAPGAFAGDGERVEIATKQPLAKVRVGTLKFGTVNWEIDVIKHHHLDEKAGVEMEVVPLASKNAAAVALQGGAVDIIVTDWFWVSRQRAENRQYSFAPYSVIAGGMMARPDANIENIHDLVGRKIGVAGGPVDKSWLMVRAYSLKTQNIDLTKEAEPVYGAPPLLNRLLEQGEFPAALTFWHYQARLKSLGMKKVFDISEILTGLGITEKLPVVGWVFHESWAEKNTAALKGFLKASTEAKEILATSDEEWRRLEKMIKPEDDATLMALRDGFREGIPGPFGEKGVAEAEKLFRILAEVGGDKLVGAQTNLAPGTFWTGAFSGDAASPAAPTD